MQLDEAARDICKPHGCRAMRCLRENGKSDCSELLTVLNSCLDKNKRELAPKFGVIWEN
jgi:hypothetical protein